MGEAPGGRRRIHVEGGQHWGNDRAPRNPLAPHSAQPTPAAPPATAHGTPTAFSEHQHRDSLARSEADVARRISDLKGRMRAAEQAHARFSEETHEQDGATLTHARTQVAAQRDAAQRATTTRFDSESTQLKAQLRDAAERLAPGWASVALGQAWTPRGPSIPADHVRVGTYDDGLPLLAPLVNHAGLTLTGPASAQVDLIRGVLVRLLAQSPLKHIVVDVFDPKLRGGVGELSGLRIAHPATLPTPALDAHSFGERLDRTMQDAARNVEISQSAGHPNLTSVWHHRDIPEGILRLVVVLDYPYAVDRSLQERLMRLASVAGPAGVSLIVAHDASALPDRDVDPSDLLDRLRRVDISPTEVRLAGHPLAARPDHPPTASFVQSMVEGLTTASRSLQGPTVELGDVMADDIAHPWVLPDGRPRESSESLDVTFGRSGHAALTLSLRTENPPHPNLLVGGAVGQGKSNLLLDLVYGLAARYSPSELELHLLDFKRGLEFKRFAPDDSGRHWLPHVKVLSLESNQAFGVAVLRHVEAEMERRSQLFKATGANSLNAYRAGGGAHTPRLVLVIDEFHALFEGEDHLVEEAVDLLARLAKQGRAYGIHLVLASQTTSGLRALAIRGDSIFAQFPLRLSLKNTPQESQAILSEGNKAAAELTYRGEVVLNRNYGADPEGSNVRGVAAYAEPGAMRALQERLWQMAHGRPPLVFVGSDHAMWEASDSLPVAGPGTLRLLLGRPMAITDVPATLTLDQDVDQAVAVIGTDARLALAALNALVRSALHQLAAAGGSLVLLDGLAEEHVSWLDALEEEANRRGVPTIRAGRAEVAATLVDVVAPRLDADGPPMLVAGLGLQRARDMETVRAQSARSANPFAITVPDFSFGPTPEHSGRGILQRLARTGGVTGVHLIGWWSTLRTLEADLGMTHAGIGRFVTAGLARDDLRAVAGVLAHPPEGWPRIGLLDRHEDVGLTTIVPFDPALTFGERSVTDVR